MEKLILDDWQKEVLEYEGDILLCTGRRVGKTQIMAIKAAEYMIKHDNTQIIIASLTEDQAKLIIIMIEDYIDNNYPKYKQTRGKQKPTQNRIALKNKSRAIARPVGQTGDALRGFNGNVLILDEVSRFNELILTAATPVLLTTGGQIWCCSTPFGKQGWFWRQFEAAEIRKDKDARFKVFYKSSEEVINNRPISESWTQEQRVKALAYLEQEKKDKSKLEYGQEYLGLFLDDLRRFFEDQVIEKQAILERGARKENDNIYYVMGCDLARMGGDHFTAEIFELNEEKDSVRHVESIVRKNLTTPENEKIIIELNQIWNPKKIGIDAGSGTLGVSVYDHLVDIPELKNKIIKMNNRDLSDKDDKQKMMKEEFYDNMRAMLERGELFLLNDEDVKRSLQCIQIELDQEGYYSRFRIFANPHNQGDICEGLVRAAWLAKHEKSLNFRFYTI